MGVMEQEGATLGTQAQAGQEGKAEARSDSTWGVLEPPWERGAQGCST